MVTGSSLLTCLLTHLLLTPNYVLLITQEEADEYRITQEEADDYPVVGGQVAAQEKDKKGKPRAPAAGSPQSQVLEEWGRRKRRSWGGARGVGV